jgi:hypothetical protein
MSVSNRTCSVRMVSSKSISCSCPTQRKEQSMRSFPIWYVYKPACSPGGGFHHPVVSQVELAHFVTRDPLYPSEMPSDGSPLRFRSTAKVATLRRRNCGKRISILGKFHPLTQSKIAFRMYIISIGLRLLFPM